MKQHKFKIAFLISFVHLLISNCIGICSTNSTFLEVIGLPYSLIAGLSELAGWDSLSLILEVVSFFIMALFFYLLLFFIEKFKKK